MEQYTTLSGWDFCHKLLKEPHIIIGGTAGSGKSVLLDDFIYTMSAYRPNTMQIYIIDLKQVSFIKWDRLPHIKRIIDREADICPTLDYLIREMYSRLSYMKANRQEMYQGSDIWCIIDEANQAFEVKGVADRVNQLLRVARATRIHIMMATQNLDRKSIPGQIWSNCSCQIGLRTISAIESRMVIKMAGCETLPRYGKAYVRNAEGIVRQEIPMTSQQDICDRLLDYGIFQF